MLEVRSYKLATKNKGYNLKLEIRNVTHALMNARKCEKIFGRTNMHADRQADRLTDGLKHTPSCTRACKHMNAFIWTYKYARGQTDRETNGRTDGRTHTYALMDARMHTQQR